MQLFAAEARGIAERPAFFRPGQKAFLEQAVECSHHRGVGQVLATMFDEFADSRVFLRPESVEHALLERSKLTQRASKWMENALHSRYHGIPHFTMSRLPEKADSLLWYCPNSALL